MGRPKLYTINESYFNKIDNANKAYILGLLYSDGHVGNGGFALWFAEKDKELLLFIKKELNLGHPIKQRNVKGSLYAGFNISNIKIYNQLSKKYKIPSNKSKNNLDFPNYIEEIMIPHFIRGYFDGDGSIWVAGKSDFKSAFCGGKNYLEHLSIILKENNISSSLRYRYGQDNHNSCSLDISGSVNIGKLYHYMYNDADLFLKRKHELMFQAAQAGERHKKRMLDSNGKGDEIIRLYKDGLNAKAIHERLNVPHSTVRNYINRKKRRNEL
jgi:hypothetical protein